MFLARFTNYTIACFLISSPHNKFEERERGIERERESQAFGKHRKTFYKI
jgi:hypothetical protein